MRGKWSLGQKRYRQLVVVLVAFAVMFALTLAVMLAVVLAIQLAFFAFIIEIAVFRK